MGLFYTTFTIRCADESAVIASLKHLRRTAFLSPIVDDYCVVYDQETEEQDFDNIEQLGIELSKACQSTVLAAALHDDDVLYLWLFQNGQQTDFYDSLPQYFDPDAEPGAPEGGDGELLCNAFGIARKTKRVEQLLRANVLEDELPEIPGELERHQALIKELGMPSFASFVTYSSIEGKYVPEMFRHVKFVQVGT